MANVQGDGEGGALLPLQRPAGTRFRYLSHDDVMLQPVRSIDKLQAPASYYRVD